MKARQERVGGNKVAGDRCPLRYDLTVGFAVAPIEDEDKFYGEPLEEVLPRNLTACVRLVCLRRSLVGGNPP